VVINAISEAMYQLSYSDLCTDTVTMSPICFSY